MWEGVIMDSSKLIKTGKKTQKVFEKLKIGMGSADFEMKEDGTFGFVVHKCGFRLQFVSTREETYVSICGKGYVIAERRTRFFDKISERTFMLQCAISSFFWAIENVDKYDLFVFFDLVGHKMHALMCKQEELGMWGTVV